MCKKDNSLGFTLGVLAGVVGGCIGAILYAPKPGRETREKIRNDINELKAKISPEIRKAKESAMSLIETTKCKIERECKKFSDNQKAQKLAKAKDKEYNIYCL